MDNHLSTINQVLEAAIAEWLVERVNNELSNIGKA